MDATRSCLFPPHSRHQQPQRTKNNQRTLANSKIDSFLLLPPPPPPRPPPLPPPPPLPWDGRVSLPAELMVSVILLIAGGFGVILLLSQVVQLRARARALERCSLQQPATSNGERGGVCALRMATYNIFYYDLRY